MYHSSLLFGTLGMILGRVITHGFNSQGKDNIIKLLANKMQW